VLRPQLYQATLVGTGERMKTVVEIASRMDTQALESLLQGNREAHDRRVLAMAESLKRLLEDGSS